MKHLTKRPDGRYCAWYKGKAFYGRTEREALAARDDFKYKCERDIDQIAPITVEEYAAQWLPVAKASVGTKCYNDYAVQLEKLCKVCGMKLMQSVTPDDIKKVWSDFVGLSDSTIHRANMLYKSMFESAIESGHCRKNPVKAESAKPHKGTKGSHRAITEEERKLIETVPHRFQTAAMIMLYAGLRRGEMVALTDKDIYDGYIHVTKAVKFAGNKPVITTPKTGSGYREVPVLAKLKPFLRDVDGYVLKSVKKDDMVTQVAFRRAWFSYLHDLSVVAGHPVKIQPHDLRHSFCTMLRDKGIDMKLAMQWMGHADEKMILQIYDHVSDKRIQSAIKALNTDKSNTSQIKNKKTVTG